MEALSIETWKISQKNRNLVSLENFQTSLFPTLCTRGKVLDSRFPNLVKKHENESQNLVLNKFIFPKLFFTPI